MKINRLYRLLAAFTNSFNLFGKKLYNFFFANDKGKADTSADGTSGVNLDETEAKKSELSIDEKLRLNKEELDALRSPVRSEPFTVAEANQVLFKNLDTLTQEEELIFQELEKAIHCSVIVNAQNKAYSSTYPIALIYEAYQQGLLTDNIFITQLELRYQTIPYFYFLTKENYSLQKPLHQRTLAHYIEIARIVYEKVRGTFFYEKDDFLRRCTAIKKQAAEQVAEETAVDAELRLRRARLRDEDRIVGVTSEGELLVPKIPNDSTNVTATVEKKLAKVVASTEEEPAKVTTKSTQKKTLYHGISVMTAVFLRGFIPDKPSLLQSAAGEASSGFVLDEIIMNSFAGNENLHGAKVKNPAKPMPPAVIIEKMDKIVGDARHKYREGLLAEKDAKTTDSVTNKMLIEVKQLASEITKRGNTSKADYELPSPTSSPEERLKSYFDMLLLEIGKLINAPGLNQHSVAIYTEIKQEIEALRNEAEAAQANGTKVYIYSKPYDEDQRSLQGLGNFLAAEYQRLNSSFYKNKMPEFRQQIHAKLYQEYNEAYLYTVQELGLIPLAKDSVQGSTLAPRTEALTLKPWKTQQTFPHFFSPVAKTVGKVGSTIGHTALAAISILD